MNKNVMLVLINHRHDAAEKVQKILTAWGCFIKTRLGLHEGVLDNCTESGLVFLELKGEKEKHNELERKLNLVKGVDAKQLSLELKD